MMWSRHAHPRTRRLLVGLLLVTAAAVWVWRLGGGGGAFDPDALRDTRGIEAVVLQARVEQGRCLLQCNVLNRSPRHAAHVVLTARLVDPRGQTLAINPLADVADLAPGQQKQTVIALPLPPQSPPHTAQIECTLVRWID